MVKTAKLEVRKIPLQRRAQATRDAIIEAAARIIATKGLAGYNTNAVAERAGVSIGSLYQYFPNKDALMVALIKRQQAEQAARLEQAFAGLKDADLNTIVRIMVAAAMQHHRNDALLATAIDHEEERLPVDAATDGTLDVASGLIVMLLTRFGSQIGKVGSQRAAGTLPAMVRAIVDRWANCNPPQLEIAEAEAIRAVLGYLR